MIFKNEDLLSELNTEEKGRIREEQVAIAYKQTFASVLPLFFIAAVVMYLFYRTVFADQVTAWFGIVVLTLIWRLGMLRAYHTDKDKYDTNIWEKHLIYVMMASALIWGGLGFFLFEFSKPLHQFFLVFLLSGLAAVASGTLASLLGVAIAFLILLLAPMSISVFFHGGFEFQMMGILCVAFFVLLSSTAKRIHVNIMSALKSKILYQKATDALAVSEDKMKHQAYYDSLTNIPNRSLLKDRIEQSLAHYRRHHNIMGLMFLDLDHFKRINDSLGHHIGDALLIETAKRLTSVCREEDTVARLGGDEFVILLNELGSDSHSAVTKAETVAKKIHNVLSFPFELGLNEPIMTSSSIGIALISGDEQTADDLLKFADTAMYQAKKEGRNTTRFYQEQMDQWIKKRIFLENGLRHAIKNGELELYYQPVIEISTKKIVGVEALLRWNHPELGIVMPDEMISIAEESGLIVPIGEWVLEEACTQFVIWKTSHPKGAEIRRVAINVSAVQFRQNDFVEKVIRIVTESGIKPSMVEIELTESLIIDKIDTVIEKMKRLREFGIGISMDDFGTGYSSLAYLKRLPFTTLKIDRSFVRDIMSDSDDAALVETIILMASIFRLDVIAEGVETPEQLEFLQRHQCRYFQGYLCSKPIQVSSFEELLNLDVQQCQMLQ